LSDESETRGKSENITNCSIFNLYFIEIAPSPTEIKEFPFTRSGGTGGIFLIFELYSWSEPPPMVLKLGQHLGGATMSTLMNFVSRNHSNTERVTGNVLQRSSAQSTFTHTARVNGQGLCLRTKELTRLLTTSQWLIWQLWFGENPARID